MKKILIISPHYPPSNLAAVHRSRLFAQHLPVFGWEPVILMVDEKYYEEELDWNLVQLLPKNQRIEKVKAFSITKPRVIGDIGLRGFFQLYKKAKQLIKKEKIDFLYIPIPSFYVALLGRWLHHSTHIKYGIDYIDPWLHHFPGSNKLFSRHWFSTQVAKFFEPIAVKKASLITGVAEGYYKGVKERNPQLLKTCLFGAMPYGGEEEDYAKLKKMDKKPYLFKPNGKFQLVYAGAMLPKAFAPLEAIFQSINIHKDQFSNIEFHFIGTGKSPDDKEGYNIKPLAEKYGIWQTIVFEYPKRIPYLDVLIHLAAADAIFILGSTEPHYTPSKIYQAVLSGKPVAAILHLQSAAVEILLQSNAGRVLVFNGETGINDVREKFNMFFGDFLLFSKSFNPVHINKSSFTQYSAKEITHQLVNLLAEI